MPIPHRPRAQATKGGRKKPPSAELTSPDTMKFVSDSLNSKSKRQAPGSKTRSTKKCKPAEVRRSDDDDHEPCARCKFAYGDKKDPHLRDNWERCSKCKKWFHETCAAIGGSYKRATFTCDACSAKKSKK
jgi:hypothetical protein